MWIRTLSQNAITTNKAIGTSVVIGSEFATCSSETTVSAAAVMPAIGPYTA